MLNLGQLVNTVQKNCHISDARHAGDFTLCIFLLKMREFYRWEHDIPFANNLPKDEVGEWLQEREGMWSDLESSSSHRAMATSSSCSIASTRVTAWRMTSAPSL